MQRWIRQQYLGGTAREAAYPAATFTSLAGARDAAGNADAARRNRAEASAILDALPRADAEQVRAWIAREAGAPQAAALTPDPRSPAED